MQYRTKLFGFLALLVLCVLVSAAFAWWSSDRARANLNAVRLTNEVLQLHLNLAANANDLFKQYADALLIGDRDEGEREGYLREVIERDLDTIREIITREIQFRGIEEADELNRLAAIERELTGIEIEFRRISALRAVEGEAAAFTALIRLLDQRMDARLRGLIDDAVEEERREVEETSQMADALVRKSRLLIELAVLLSLVVAGFAVVILGRSLDMRLKALVAGTKALRSGDLSHRIRLATRDEFGALANDFDGMAEELQSARSSLEQARSNLQSEVRERTAELQSANRRLADQDALRKRFLADISHELRTPLTVIRGEAEVSLRSRHSELGEGGAEVLRGIVEQVDHMARLVDDLLFVARREAGEARLALRPVQIGPLLASTVGDADVLASAKDVRVLLDDDAKGLSIQGDPGRLRQLFLVLLDNAVRYSPRGGEVRVRVLQGPGSLTVRVADSGIGNAAEALPFVFERFVRGSNALAGGSGLGLPVARAIAEAHNGTLVLESVEGQGTVASFTVAQSQGSTTMNGPRLQLASSNTAS